MKKNVDPIITDYPSGLRSVYLQRPGTMAGICGVVILAGSRDEEPGEYGLAHFVEHTIFKGTRRRRSTHIINRMEAVGGELNAFTSKTDTVVYTLFPRPNLGRGMELVADLVQNSRFPQNQLEKERMVVEDEIASYLDTPADAVFDDFEDIIFKDTPLGHNILGNRETLATFSTATCMEWLAKHYIPQKMVVFYAGAEGIGRFLALIEKHFPTAHIAESNLEAKGYHVKGAPDFHISRQLQGNHQTHCVMGRVYDASALYTRCAMGLASNILGGPGMNSRLNVQMREKRGLVYSVESSLSTFGNTGLMTVYFGCDPEDAKTCRHIVEREIAKLASTPLSQAMLGRAIKQYLGQLTLSYENNENRIIGLARQLATRGKIYSPDEVGDIIKSLTPASLCEQAQKMLSPSFLEFAPV